MEGDRRRRRKLSVGDRLFPAVMTDYSGSGFGFVFFSELSGFRIFLLTWLHPGGVCLFPFFVSTKSRIKLPDF